MFNRQFPVEVLVWIGAFVFLYGIEPHGTHGFTLCPLALADIAWCPGCGLGESIHYLLHGEWTKAIEAHWLGPIASVLLLYRSVTLLNMHIKYSRFKTQKQST